MNLTPNKVSIVIPVFNLESFLEKCLDSLVSQTYDKLEVIIVDDGSTDKSVSIINEYLLKDLRFKLIKINHHGAASARKVGIQHATGAYITFVDGDDYIEQDAIEVLFNEITKNDCDIVIAKHRKILLGDCKISLQSDYPFQDIDKLTFSNFINSKKDFTLWGKVFKLDLFEDINFHEGIPIGEDALVLNQVILKAKKIKAINHIVYNYIIHKDSISHKIYSKISSKLLYIKGSLDNVSIFSQEKQTEEIHRIFYELLEYGKYYIKMNYEEKKLYNNIWLNYFDKNTITSILLGNHIVGYKYWFSTKSPKFYSAVQLSLIYFNIIFSKCRSKMMNYF